MKVFLADEWLVSTSELVLDGWCAPWTAAAVHGCTRDFLDGTGDLGGTLGDASLVLLDVVDYLAPLAERSLAKLSQEAATVGIPLVVRLHGAWRNRPTDFDECEGPDLRSIWEYADAVLVGSRSHLVRLASTSGIDPARTHLAPVAIAGPAERRESPVLGVGARTQILVAGETHRSALSPVLAMLSEADPKKATFQVVRGEGAFRAALGEARVLLVPSTGAFGDRSLVDAALREGVSVVAASGASVLDAPLPKGLVVVSESGSNASWREALEATLLSVPSANPSALAEILGQQHRVLARIQAAGEPVATG